MIIINDHLQHYGVLGMKWGVRRTPEQLGRAKKRVDATSGIVTEAGKINKSLTSARHVSTLPDLSTMTDKELKAIVNRMNMEQQYKNLSANNLSKGQVYAKTSLEVAGSVLAITGSVIGLALTMKELKKD